MKEKDFENFWLGFFVSVGIALGLYWLYRQKREVSPAPLVLARDKSALRKVETEPAQPASPDDLEVISGIGPATARRLNEAGITTYAQLAAMTPGELDQISGTGRWDPADWIAEAKKLK